MNQNHFLFFLYLFIWIVLAIDPWYREDWLLENLLVFFSLPIIVWGERSFGFSRGAAWMLFIFFTVHAIGAHYTYSEMPWFTEFTRLFGFERNHYDRLAHFLFGFLLFLPYFELFNSFGKSRRHAYLFTFVFMFAASGFYEVLEWVATEATNPDLGVAFLGIQGDQWDAQKDMAMCYLGTIMAALVWRRKALS